VSARYAVHAGGRAENQSSSGIIVSTGLGSTGWMKSVFAGAAGISGRDITTENAGQFPWDADHLCYLVREPFPSRTTGTSLICGKITESQPLLLESHMAGNGVIFSDGIEKDFLSFNAGMNATVGVADKCGHLVV